MNCMDCAQQAVDRVAVALCHHCYAALCHEHAKVLEEPLERRVPIRKTEPAPRSARLVLCEVCRAAFEQTDLVQEA